MYIWSRDRALSWAGIAGESTAICNWLGRISPSCSRVSISRMEVALQSVHNFYHALTNSYIFRLYLCSHQGSSVGIATELRAGRSGDRIPVGGEIFRTCPNRPWSPAASCTMGTGFFQRVKSGRRVTLTPHPLLVPWSWKSRAILLLPLWAVRPVQSLSAC